MSNPIEDSANVLRNICKRRNSLVAFRKVVSRLLERDGPAEAEAALEWCCENLSDVDEFLGRHAPELATEAVALAEHMERSVPERLDSFRGRLNLESVGGPADYRLLYYIVRLTRARRVVETGVAAGWSSSAVLTALERNSNGGRLFSSDFPYLRLRNPEGVIGAMVEDRHRSAWELFIDGDAVNLAVIAERLDAIDLLHYDSDKTRGGRERALQLLGGLFTDETIVVFDDVHCNLQFRDLVERSDWAFRVFSFDDKYVGVTGPGARVLFDGGVHGGCVSVAKAVTGRMRD